MDTPNIDVAKYGSRKFIVTMSCIVATVVLAIIEVLTNPVALVLSAAIASYNWANSRSASTK